MDNGHIPGGLDPSQAAKKLAWQWTDDFVRRARDRVVAIRGQHEPPSESETAFVGTYGHWVGNRLDPGDPAVQCVIAEISKRARNQVASRALFEAVQTEWLEGGHGRYGAFVVTGGGAATLRGLSTRPTCDIDIALFASPEFESDYPDRTAQDNFTHGVMLRAAARMAPLYTLIDSDAPLPLMGGTGGIKETLVFRSGRHKFDVEMDAPRHSKADLDWIGVALGGAAHAQSSVTDGSGMPIPADDCNQLAANKMHAAYHRGDGNGRLKDYGDLLVFARGGQTDADAVARLLVARLAEGILGARHAGCDGTNFLNASGKSIAALRALACATPMSGTSGTSSYAARNWETYRRHEVTPPPQPAPDGGKPKKRVFRSFLSTNPFPPRLQDMQAELSRYTQPIAGRAAGYAQKALSALNIPIQSPVKAVADIVRLERGRFIEWVQGRLDGIATNGPAEDSADQAFADKYRKWHGVDQTDIKDSDKCMSEALSRLNEHVRSQVAGWHFYRALSAEIAERGGDGVVGRIMLTGATAAAVHGVGIRTTRGIDVALVMSDRFQESIPDMAGQIAEVTAILASAAARMPDEFGTAGIKPLKNNVFCTQNAVGIKLPLQCGNVAFEVRAAIEILSASLARTVAETTGVELQGRRCTVADVPADYRPGIGKIDFTVEPLEQLVGRKLATAYIYKGSHGRFKDFHELTGVGRAIKSGKRAVAGFDPNLAAQHTVARLTGCAIDAMSRPPDSQRIDNQIKDLEYYVSAIRNLADGNPVPGSASLPVGSMETGWRNYERHEKDDKRPRSFLAYTPGAPPVKSMEAEIDDLATPIIMCARPFAAKSLETVSPMMDEWVGKARATPQPSQATAARQVVAPQPVPREKAGGPASPQTR